MRECQRMTDEEKDKIGSIFIEKMGKFASCFRIKTEKKKNPG